MFDLDQRNYEILLSACSPNEEHVWKANLAQKGDFDNSQDLSIIHHNLSSDLAHDIKPLVGLYVQGQPLPRRISIRRAVTVGPKSQMCQVVLRNTVSPEHAPPSNTSTTSIHMSRSHTQITPNHITLLCPRKSERIHLEIAMTDLYTKEALPFPGMKGSDNPFRASAHSVMRKLSIASITSTFSRRSTSLVSLHSTKSKQPLRTKSSGGNRIDKGRAPALHRVEEAVLLPSAPHVAQSAVTLKPAVDFHKTPEAFLPPDFSLRDLRATTLPRNTGLRAMTSKQVLANNPDIPDYRKVKRSVSMSIDLKSQNGTVPLAERPRLQITKSEVTRRKSLDGRRILEEIPLRRPAAEKENDCDFALPELKPTHSGLKPLSKRILELIR